MAGQLGGAATDTLRRIDSTKFGQLVRRAQWLRWTAAIFVAGLWVHKVWVAYVALGLFSWLGVDFRHYYIQAVVARVGSPASIYDPGVLAQHTQSFEQYTSEQAVPLEIGVPAYPPLFAWLFGLFTLPTAPLGLALWTALNLLAVLWLAYRVASLFPGPAGFWAGLLAAGSYPIGLGLFLGQPMPLLACAVGEAYLALRARRDVRAGLWTSCLVLKLHYAPLLGLWLVWQRPWAALVASFGGVMIMLASAVVLGIPALLAFAGALIAKGEPFYGVSPENSPIYMTNWRGLLVQLSRYVPGISDEVGSVLTLFLSAATLLSLAAALRRVWYSGAPIHSASITLVLLATVLVNYHSHAYAAALLAVPTAAVFAEGSASYRTRAILLAAALLPTLGFVLSRLGSWVPPLFTVLLVASYGSLLADLWFAGQRHHRASPGATSPHARSQVNG